MKSPVPPGSQGRREGERYEIVLHEEADYIFIRVEGVWDRAVTESYRRDLRRASIYMYRRGGYKGAIFDASAYPPQSSEVIAEHGAAMRMARWIYKVKAAVIVPDMASDNQVARIARQAWHPLFLDEREARLWLLG